MSRLASRTTRIDASGIRRVFDLARSLENPINLSFSERDTHFRICYTVPNDLLREGAALLCRLADA